VIFDDKGLKILASATKVPKGSREASPDQKKVRKDQEDFRPTIKTQIK